METAQPLHPESKKLVELIARMNAKTYDQLNSVEEARARSRLTNTSRAVAGDVHYDGTRKELFVPLPDFTGSLRLRLAVHGHGILCHCVIYFSTVSNFKHSIINVDFKSFLKACITSILFSFCVNVQNARLSVFLLCISSVFCVSCLWGINLII